MPTLLAMQCEYCFKIVFKQPCFINRGKHNYCSNICKLEGYKQKCKEKRELKYKSDCLSCGKSFIPNDRQKKKYCSRSCQTKGQITSTEKECLQCNKKFLVKPFTLKRTDMKKAGTFCSRSCAMIYQLKLGPIKNTKIEVAMRIALVKNNILFKEQSPIKGVGIPDFIINERIIVQCDGDYWHSLIETKRKDATQDLRYNFMGFKVLRFSETAIKKNIGKCINKIKREIKNV